MFTKNRRAVPPNAEPPYHPIWSNFGFLLTTNFKLIIFFIPSLICLYTFLIVGGLVFLAAALVLLLPSGPAVCAMYDIGYQLARQVEKHERRSFFRSYRMNLGQGVATMAVQIPFIAVLLLVLLTGTERPVWVTLCLILGAVMLMMFGALAFSQVALIPLSLGKIWKNAVMLIPLCGWRGLVAAVVQLAYIAVLYQWAGVGVIFFVFVGPALLIVWSATLLWPKLEEILLDSGE